MLPRKCPRGPQAWSGTPRGGSNSVSMFEFKLGIGAWNWGMRAAAAERFQAVAPSAPAVRRRGGHRGPTADMTGAAELEIAFAISSFGVGDADVELLT